jgi:membrane-associated phospholipid phosphatase
VRVRRCLTGAALLVGSYVEIRRPAMRASEERIFRAANRAPDAITLPVRAVMQAGTFVTVPIAAVVALVTGRRRLAAEIAVVGTAAWFGAKAIKPIGGRGRPLAVLADPVLRERIEGDHGWVSGHTAVATALAGVIADEVPRWARPLVWSIPVATAFGRLHVGAHLPQDTVGGAGLGLILSSLVPARRQDSNERYQRAPLHSIAWAMPSISPSNRSRSGVGASPGANEPSGCGNSSSSTP